MMTHATKNTCSGKENQEDRISDLPEELLMHVMSFLTTKESVQTGILAKHWRRIWLLVPVLKFDLKDWIDGADPDNYEKWKQCETKFNKFVNEVLEKRGQSHLNVFQYTLSSKRHYSEVSLELLDRVILCRPREINVSVDSANAVEIPDSVFSCTSLQKLHLDILNTTETTIIRPELINMPSLKKIVLYGVELKDDFTQQLFSGCPVLESLILGCCTLNFFVISSDVLKKLVLSDCWHDKQLEISCPNIECLVVRSDYQERGILLKNMVSLVSADFSLDTSVFDTDGAMNLLSGVSNVSILMLDVQCPEFKVYYILIT
jgi:F-box domain